ncbi:MAG TPA: hypothetical protein VLA33_09855 [Gemmatimonadota bacterium]|nr:hypothetical protein [Gemmatimonadota bacterium]
MNNPWVRVALFVVVLVAAFVWAGGVLSRASGETRRAAPGEGVSAENGELIFWGSGKCHTCHAVGTRGRSVRGPDLGVASDGEAMMTRAARRAAERSAARGREMSATDYLVEALVDPGAYVVEGFKDEMPAIHEPPIQLDPDELRSVVLYLQTLGDAPDPAAIELPSEVLRASRAAPVVTPWQPYLEGEPERGRALFFDPDGPARCAGCHRVGDEGGDIGPELTAVAGTRTLPSIVESLLQPAASIPAGYESELIETTGGRIFDGLVVRETADSLWLVTALEEEYAVALEEVARRRTQDTSLMPDDLARRLSVRQFHDLVAYLRTLE